MAFEVRDNPTFSWSSSRSRLFEECPLCYGLYYYGAHNGWLDKATPLAQAAYRYKVTKSTEQRLMESITGKIYDHYYKGAIAIQDMHDSVRIDLKRAFVASRDYKEKWYEQPKQVPVLAEMIDQDELPAELIQSVTDVRKRMIDNFYNTYTEKEIKLFNLTPVRLSRFNKFNLYRLNNLTVFIGLHLLYRNDKGQMVAVNFKTDGKASHIDQLGSIALYLIHTYSETLDNIIIRDEFLLTGEYKEHQLSEDDIEEMHEVIEDSVNMMAECVTDGDLTRNEGLPMEYFSRSAAHSDECEVANCPYCQLVKLDLEKYPNGIKSYAL